MTIRRGGIYLVNLNPSKGREPGKIRPCLVIQSDFLNEAGHPTTAILPMTSQLVEGAPALRFTVEARDKLQQDSQVLIDLPRAIDNRRFASDMLTRLEDPELLAVEERLLIALGLERGTKG